VKGNLSRGNFSCYVALIKPRLHSSSGVFYMWEISLTLVFTCIFIYLSISFKIVWPQVLSSQATCRSRRCYRNKEKGTVTSQKPNLCLWGTFVCGELFFGNFPQKNLRTEKIPRQLIFISIKAFNKSAVHKWKFSAELFTIQVIVIKKQSSQPRFYLSF